MEWQGGAACYQTRRLASLTLQILPIAPVLSVELAAQLMHATGSEGISLAQLKKRVLYTLWKHVQRYPIVMMLEDEENGSPGLHTFVMHSGSLKIKKLQ